MAGTLQFKRRAVGGQAGAPSSLKTAEPAYNQQDGYIYIGSGDDGAGNATSNKTIGHHDFSILKLVPAGGTAGQILTKSSSTDYAFAWANAPQGGQTYTAGTGISISGTTIAIDDAVVATETDLANGLASKANVTHTHSASDITSGVFDVARIPVLPSTKVQVASGDLTTLTTTQQNEIVQGSVVTTSDGYRYVYSGSGSKTVSGSYVQLADITPDWSSIANKPTFATVATSGSYTDLSNRPSLGTMSSQNSSAVTITGGTISGVTINSAVDGGTF